MSYEQGENTRQIKEHEDVLKWNITSSNIIKIVLGTEFDLTITQIKSKIGEDNMSTKEMISFFNMNKTKHPFYKERSRI